jgi:hypothetical protein
MLNTDSPERYDKLAFRYVTYATIPLLGGYTIYSLVRFVQVDQSLNSHTPTSDL